MQAQAKPWVGVIELGFNLALPATCSVAFSKSLNVSGTPEGNGSVTSPGKRQMQSAVEGQSPTRRKAPFRDCLTPAF